MTKYFDEKAHEQRAIETLKKLGYTNIKGKDFPRDDITKVINKKTLRDALCRINPTIPNNTIRDAITQIDDLDNHINSNIKFLDWIRNGLKVSYQDNNGETKGDFVNLIDYANTQNNIFDIVDQLTIRGANDSRRTDLIIYINGLPIMMFELKSPSKNDSNLHVDAFNQIDQYKAVIPKLFTYNCILAIDDGLTTRIGTSTADFSRFLPWSSIDGEKQLISSLDTVIHGLCQPDRIIEILRDFVFYIYNGKQPMKICANWHQYFSVKKALPATAKALTGDKKIGVLWHTQGSGKSFTMVMYSSLLARDFNNPTIVVLTDRNDLDDQLFGTFNKAKTYLHNTTIQANNSNHLKEILVRQSGGIIFSTIQKFIGEERSLIECLSDRKDIIVIVDEAHRSHYGTDYKIKSNKDDKTIDYGYSFTKQVRTALPNASFIGFTGTPIEDKDRSTKDIFGNNIHIYGLSQSVEDGMTTKITYHSRIAKLKLNDPILAQIDNMYEEALEDGANVEIVERSKRDFAKSELLYSNAERIKLIGQDIVNHFETKPQQELKGMVVCSSREAASIMYDAIIEIKPEWTDNVKVLMTSIDSDSQELKRFKTTKEERVQLAENFKNAEHNFKLAIVVDMWLTGFDVPCLGVMYLDKELEKHNLMQAIARVNRVYPDKDCGLIYDYRGIFSKLQDALKMYAQEDVLSKNIEARDNILDYNELSNGFKTLLEQVDEFFFGIVDINELLDPNKTATCFYTALDHLQELYLTNDEQLAHIRGLVSKLNSIYKMCHQEISEDHKKLAVMIIALNSSISKSMNVGEYSTVSLNKKIKQLIPETIITDEIEDVSAMINSQNGVDILNSDILKKIVNLPYKNISIKTIESLLNDKINTTRKKNITLSDKYSDKLKNILLQYENKSISSSEILEALLNMAKEFSEENNNAKKLELSEEEYAFYCAIATKSIDEVITEQTLCDIAHKLVKIIRESKTLDWYKKSSAKAKMRIAIKNLLKEYKYPPNEQEDATKQIIHQAEQQELSQ